LSKAFMDHILEYDSGDLDYITFDFHQNWWVDSSCSTWLTLIPLSFAFSFWVQLLISPFEFSYWSVSLRFKVPVLICVLAWIMLNFFSWILM
jgi:hypothetical protein